MNGWLRTVGLAAISAAAIYAPDAAATEFDCIMDASVTVRVGSPAPGLLEEVLVGRGDAVRAGQPLARLRSEVEEATVEMLAEQASSDAEVAAQQARLSLGMQVLERRRALVERQAVPVEQLEEAEAAVEVATRELGLTEMRRRLAGFELERAQALLDQRTIRSPIDGFVVERLLFAGEFVHQEAHVVTVAALDPLHVEAFLPVAFYPALVVGSRAFVRPAPPLEGEREGTVVVVDRVFDSASGTFGVRVALSNPGADLPAGHRCTVRFEGVSDG